MSDGITKEMIDQMCATVEQSVRRLHERYGTSITDKELRDIEEIRERFMREHVTGASKTA